MRSIFLTQFQQLYGEDFIDDPSLLEAFTQNENVNRSLAIVGDSFLNLVVNKTAYCKSKDPKYLDVVRKKFAEKKANQKTLNNDSKFTKYLVTRSHTRSPVGGIGLEKADRFFEAIIGAVYISHGFEIAEKYVITVLNTNANFVVEFPEELKRHHFCSECKIDYPWSEWDMRPVFEDLNGTSSGGWFDHWELICPMGHKISEEHL